MVWFSCSLEVSLPLSGNGIAGQMGGWTCLSLQHGHHWGPDDHPQKVHATGKSDEKTTDWYLLNQVLGNKSLQRKRNADMTHHGWTHIQRVVSMSPMRNYVPVLLGCPAGPRRFWCTVCSGTPVSEKLNEEWPPSLVPGLSVFLHTSSSSPYILPARRTVTHANYTVTGEEKTHIFFSPHSSWGFLFICPLFITHSDKEVLSPPTTISPNEISLGWIQFYLNWLDRGAQHIQPILKEIRLSLCTWCKNNQQAKWAWIGRN